jgi:hypothetical protein
MTHARATNNMSTHAWLFVAGTPQLYHASVVVVTCAQVIIQEKVEGPILNKL